MRTRLALLLAVLAATLAAAPAADARMLRLGDRGTDVTALNQRLIALGYLPPGAATDRYAAATMHAVMAVQKWHGLARDGVAGPMTQTTLRSARRPVPEVRAGGRRIEVLYSRQVALLIDSGRVRRIVPVSTGADGYRTPPGAFRVYRKELRSWSYPYSVFLPYASYFYRGVAFHQWDVVPSYPASHGCVRVPVAFAAEVYRFATMGTRVDVVYPPGQLGGDEAPDGPYGP